MAVDYPAPFRVQIRGVATPHALKHFLRQLRQLKPNLQIESLTAADWLRPAIVDDLHLVAEHVAALKIGWAQGSADLVLEAGPQRLLLVAGDGDWGRSFDLNRQLRDRLRAAILRELQAFRTEHAG